MPFPLIISGIVAVAGAAARKMQADAAAKANLRAAAQARKQYGDDYTGAAQRAAKLAADQARADQISMARGAGTASSQASAIQAASQRQGAVSAQSQLVGARVGEGYAGGIADLMSRRADIDQNYQRMRNESQNAIIAGAGNAAMVIAGSDNGEGGTGAKPTGAALAPSVGSSAGSTAGYGRLAPSSYSAGKQNFALTDGGYNGAGRAYGTGGGSALIDNSDEGLGTLWTPSGGGVPEYGDNRPDPILGSTDYNNDGLDDISGGKMVGSDERMKRIYGGSARITGDAGGPIDSNPRNVGSGAPMAPGDVEEKKNLWEKVTEPFGGHFGWTRGIIGDKGADSLNRAMTPPSRASDFKAGGGPPPPRDATEWEYNSQAMGGSGQISDAHSKQHIQKLSSDNAEMRAILARAGIDLPQKQVRVDIGEAVMEPEPRYDIKMGGAVMEPEPQYKVDIGGAVMEPERPQFQAGGTTYQMGEAVMEPEPQYKVDIGEATMEQPLSDAHSKTKIVKLEAKLAEEKLRRKRSEGELRARLEKYEPFVPYDSAENIAAAEEAKRQRANAFVPYDSAENIAAAEKKIAEYDKIRAKQAEARRVIIGYKKNPDGSLDADRPIYKVAGYEKNPDGSLNADKPIYAEKPIQAKTKEEGARAWSNAPEVTGWTAQEAAQYNNTATNTSEAEAAAARLRQAGVGGRQQMASPAPPQRRQLPPPRPSLTEKRAQLMAQLDSIDTTLGLAPRRKPIQTGLDSIDIDRASGGSFATQKPTVTTPNWLTSDERTKNVDRSGETSASLSGYKSPSGDRAATGGGSERVPLRQEGDATGSIDSRGYSRGAIMKFLARNPDYTLDDEGILRSQRLPEHTLGGVGGMSRELPERRRPPPPRDILAKPEPERVILEEEPAKKAAPKAAPKVAPKAEPDQAPPSATETRQMFPLVREVTTAQVPNAKGPEKKSAEPTISVAQYALELRKAQREERSKRYDRPVKWSWFGSDDEQEAEHAQRERARRSSEFDKKTGKKQPETRPAMPRSDKRTKTVGARTAAAKVFEKTPGYSYEYKPEFLGRPGTKPGMQVGIMAQDLEKTPAGKTVVQKDRQGLRSVDTNRLSLLTAGAMNDVMSRLKALEKRKK